MENQLYDDGSFFNSYLIDKKQGVFITVRGGFVDSNDDQRLQSPVLHPLFGEGRGCWSALSKVKDEVREAIQDKIGPVDQYTVLLRHGNILSDMNLPAGHHRMTQDLHTDVEAYQVPELAVFSVIVPLGDQGTSIYVPDSADHTMGRSLLLNWCDSYNDSSNTYTESEVVPKELLLEWDQTAAQKAKEEELMEQRRDNPSLSLSLDDVFPIELEEYKIKFGQAYVFDAKTYLHAGGPGSQHNRNYRLHFYAVCTRKGKEDTIPGEFHKYLSNGLSHVEYRLDLSERGRQEEPFSAFTYSVHSYDYGIGLTPGLASMFGEGPSILVEEEKEQRKVKKVEEKKKK